MSLTARRVAIQHRNPCIWRTFATETTHESESRRPLFPRRQRSLDSDTDERARIPRTSVARRSIYVRAWDHPTSMADAFAIVRGIERKYGRIRDFKWVRDWEMPQTYQSILWAAFFSEESFDRVPKMGETIHIPAPDIDSTREGGVGFRELQGLLYSSGSVGDQLEAPQLEAPQLEAPKLEAPQPEAPQPEAPAPDNMQRVIVSDSEPGPRMLDVKVERALNETVFYPSIQVPSYSPKKMTALGNALLDWGGFAPMKPMFGSQSPYNSDQEDVPVDNEGMRKILNMAAQLTSRPDPSFETAEVSEVKVEKVKVEMKRDVEKEEREHVQPAPVRINSRSWSLPPPPPDSQTTTTSPSKRAKTGRSPNPKKSPAGTTTTARQQQILAQARQAKQPAAGNKSKGKGDGQKQESTTNKDAKKTKKPAPALKQRIWDVVNKWF